MKIFLLLSLTLGSMLSAQFVPALFVEGEKETRDQLRVDQVDVKVVILGNIAETSLTMRFRNETNRVLEGEFVCPLNEGQLVSGYALEIEGEMRAGVALEKQEARQVFEDIVRQNIDPGLAEWTKGNHFKTRVYPIPAKGTKRVGVTFRETLPLGDEGLQYRLPLDFKKPLTRFSISMLAPQALGEQKEIEDSSSGLTFSQSAKRGWRLGAIRKNFTPKGPVEVLLPISQGSTVSLGPGPEGERYFHVMDRVLRPALEGVAPDLAKSIHVVWDASGSGESRDHEKERALLRQLLTQHAGAKLRLSFLRNELQTLEGISGLEALLKELEEVAYDGGTDLRALDLSQFEEERVILVSDGIGTLGKGRVKLGKGRVDVIHAAKSADHDGLKQLAKSTGGRYANLLSLSVDAASAFLTQPVFQLLSVEGADDCLPNGPIPVSQNGVIDFSGQLKGKGPLTLTLNYGYTGKVLSSHKVIVDPEKDSLTERLVADLWAGHQLAALMGEKEKNREQIIALGKTFSLVTPFTSLLVLDRIEDYVEHRIIPPTEKLRKEYHRLIQLEQPEKEEVVDADHLADLLTRWKELKQWHEKDFDPIDVLLFHRLVEDRKALADLLKRRVLSKKKNVTRKERKQLESVDKKLADLQKSLAVFGEVPPSERRKVISDYASRYAKIRKVLYGGRSSVSNIVTAGNRSGAAAIGRNVIDGILNRPAPSNSGGDDPFGDVKSEGTVSPAPSAPIVLPSGGGGDPFAGSVDAGGRSSSPAVTITLAKWDPKTPYLEALKKSAKSQQEKVYLDWKKKNLKSSAFYLDVSDFFLEQGQKKLALRVLTNVAELDLENIPLMRILGHRLNQLGEHQAALAIFEEVLDLRKDEPQSRRDVALTLSHLKRYQDAGDLLWEVIKVPSAGRFEGIELIALVELNALIAQHGIQTSSYDQRFIGAVDCDARIVLTWDSNDSDMDLWVTDPVGELCNYSQNRTQGGGRMSDDFTDGYGPEEFLVKDALHGKYQVEVNFYGTRQQIIAGATTLQVEIFSHWGRKNQKSQKVTLRLKERSELVFVGEFELR